VVKLIHIQTPDESNPVINYIHKHSYSHHSANNYRNAVAAAFRLLSSEKRSHPLRPLDFDQDLCKTLVIKWGLSCVDCGLDCDMHDLEALR
jgi:hypothetical protein